MHLTRRRRALTALTTALAVAVGLAVAPAATAATRATAYLTVTAVTPTAAPLVSGQTVKVGGRASANLVGRTLRVERWTGSAWVKVTAYVKVGSDRTFSGTLRSAGVGLVRYRVAYPGSTTVKPAVSASKGVYTYRWRYLSRTDAKDARLAYSTSASIDGKQYANTVRLDRNNTFDGYVAYDLKRACTSFVMVAGVPDDNPITGKALMHVLHDDQVVTSQTLSGGTAFPVAQDVRGVLELRVERDYVSGAYHDLALGDARVLCRF